MVVCSGLAYLLLSILLLLMLFLNTTRAGNEETQYTRTALDCPLT